MNDKKTHGKNLNTEKKYERNGAAEMCSNPKKALFQTTKRTHHSLIKFKFRH